MPATAANFVPSADMAMAFQVFCGALVWVQFCAHTGLKERNVKEQIQQSMGFLSLFLAVAALLTDSFIGLLCKLGVALALLTSNTFNVFQTEIGEKVTRKKGRIATIGSCNSNTTNRFARAHILSHKQVFKNGF